MWGIPMFGLRTKLYNRFGLYPQIKDRDGYVARFHHKTKPATRYGWGRKPANRFFERELRERAPALRPRLERYAALAPFFARIARNNDGSLKPCWDNPRIPVLDCVSLCGMIEEFKPSRLVEIGSGYSTRFICAAAEEFVPHCDITVIDPFPDHQPPAFPRRFVQQRLEDADLSVFETLRANDIVWMDGSHHCYSNTDVSTFYLDVIPSLAPGVIVGVHDIYVPWDYPPEWEKTYCNELQVVATYLIGAGRSLEYLFPSFYISDIDAELRAILDPIWRLPALSEPFTNLRGCSAFWWRTPGRGVNA